jgi:hypothetical protein
MIDFQTYKQLHPGSERTSERTAPRLSISSPKGNLPAFMTRDDLPPYPDLLVLPNTVVAYNCHHKKWGAYLLELRH